LLGYKSFNYWSNYLAYQDAIRRGYDEVIWINERDEICEASRSNLFWVRHGIIFTPDTACGLLPGISRSIVLELAGELSLPVRVGAYQLSSLSDAQEMFLTNSVRGIQRATARLTGNASEESPVTDLLIRAYEARVEQYIAKNNAAS